MATNYPDSFRIGKRSNIDDRYGKWDGTHQVPYESVSEANSLISTFERAQGLTVMIKVGDNKTTEYWYRDGTGDNHLVPKNNFIILSANSDGTFTLLANSLILGFMLKASSAAPAFKIGTTLGGDNLTGGPIPLVANQSTPVFIPFFADVDTVLYFSGFNAATITITILKP